MKIYSSEFELRKMIKEQLTSDDYIDLWNDMCGLCNMDEEMTHDISEVDMENLTNWLVSDGRVWLSDYGII